MPFCFEQDTYNPFDLLNVLVFFFTSNPCPLCKKHHTLKFHSFIERKSNGKKILVIKIICIGNHKKRKLTGKNIPYTITILPAFLQPYARKTTQSIIKSVINYIFEKKYNQQEAAFLMGTESPFSFSRYYNRITNRIDEWVIYLIKKISEITACNNFDRLPDTIKTFQQKWSYFTALIHDYLKAVEKLETGLLIFNQDKISFVLAILSINHQGLGP